MSRTLQVSAFLLVLVAVVVVGVVGTSDQRSALPAPSGPSEQFIGPKSGGRDGTLRDGGRNVREFLEELDPALSDPHALSNDDWQALRQEAGKHELDLALRDVAERIDEFESVLDDAALERLPRAAVFGISRHFFRRWGQLDPEEAWRHVLQRALVRQTADDCSSVSAVLSGWSRIDARAAAEHHRIVARAQKTGELRNRVIRQPAMARNWAKQHPDEALEAIIGGELLGFSDLGDYFAGLSELGSVREEANRVDQYLETREHEGDLSPERMTRLRVSADRAFAEALAREDLNQALAWFDSRRTPGELGPDHEEAMLNHRGRIVEVLHMHDPERIREWLVTECGDDRITRRIARFYTWEPPEYRLLSTAVSSHEVKRDLAVWLIGDWNGQFRSNSAITPGRGWAREEIIDYVKGLGLGADVEESLLESLGVGENAHRRE